MGLPPDKVISGILDSSREPFASPGFNRNDGLGKRKPRLRQIDLNVDPLTAGRIHFEQSENNFTKHHLCHDRYFEIIIRASIMD